MSDLDEDDENEGSQLVRHVELSDTPTLLPSPIANAISLVTRSSSLLLGLGSFIGGLTISGARATTLTSLEVSRAVLEAVLTRAGRDVVARSRGELGASDAENILERSLGTLHSTITSISFVASTSFQFSAAALYSASDLSQQVLAVLDSILGSTDSSRAIASIITLIRREFQNPATGAPGEKVSVSDLMLGLCSLALLQRWCHELTARDQKKARVEEVLWDIVILDDGRKADVVGTTNRGSRTPQDATPGSDLTTPDEGRPMSFVTASGHEQIIETISRPDWKRELDATEELELDLRNHIMEQLPPGARVSITTSTTTTKTITLEVTGAYLPDLAPPPGVELIEENVHTANRPGSSHLLPSEGKSDVSQPQYRVVYRIRRNNTRGANIEAGDHPESANFLIKDFDEEEEDSDDEEGTEMGDVLGAEEVSDAHELGQDPGPSEKPILNRELHTFSPLSFGPDEPATPPRPGTSTSLRRTRTSEGDDNTTPSRIPIPTAGNSANEKRTRKPVSSSSSLNTSDSPSLLNAAGKRPAAKKTKSDASAAKRSDKKSFRSALKKGSTTALTNLFTKEPSTSGPSNMPESSSSAQRPAWGANKPLPPKPSTISRVPVAPRGSSIVPARNAPSTPRTPRRGASNPFSSRDLGTFGHDAYRSPSRTSYYSIHEHRRDSMVSQTETYSIHSNDPTRPNSPVATRSHIRSHSALMRTRPENTASLGVPTSPRSHRRAKSYVPSIYTLPGDNSDMSLAVARPQKSVYDDRETLQGLARTGHIPGLFPDNHFVHNISRFVRFATASYGSHFMRVMGITSNTSTAPLADNLHHHEHHSFSSHTQLPADTILLSSFVDPQGGTDATGQTNTGVPMVHFVSIDHDSKAVVLTCRGTLGFEDVLTDMTCDYDEMTWRGKAYSVHKGIHSSARRLLSGGGGKVLATLRAALEEFPDYGIVLTGHSLGGGVVALLAIMISEPSSSSSSGSAFVTTASLPQLLLTSGNLRASTSGSQGAPVMQLPPGRPIHVYAYGPPATVSPSLRLATRGLITTIVNGQDLVPYLSLGVLHDMQAVALAFKTDTSGAKAEVRNRVWDALTSGFADRWYGNDAVRGLAEDDQWAYASLKTLRASMLSAKLVPPGEVFGVGAQPVLRREAFGASSGESAAGAGHAAGHLGRPATRAVLRYVRDVEGKFGELCFGQSMLLDHSPGRYEASLAALQRGVVD